MVSRFLKTRATKILYNFRCQYRFSSIASYSAWHARDFSVTFSDDWDVDFDHSVTAYSHDMRFGKELVSCRIGPYPYSQNGQIIAEPAGKALQRSSIAKEIW